MKKKQLFGFICLILLFCSISLQVVAQDEGDLGDAGDGADAVEGGEAVEAGDNGDNGDAAEPSEAPEPSEALEPNDGAADDFPAGEDELPPAAEEEASTPPEVSEENLEASNQEATQADEPVEVPEVKVSKPQSPAKETVKAQNNLNLELKKEEKIDQSMVIPAALPTTLETKDKSQKLFPEGTIVDYDPESGIPASSYDIAQDNVRQSLLVHGNLFRPLLGFEYQFAANCEVFWLEAFASLTQTQFNTIADNKAFQAGNANPRAESNISRSPTASQKLLHFGGGLGYRFPFPQQLNFMHWLNLYQSTSAFLTFITLDESSTSTEYQGLGLKADYGIHKRLSTHNHLGFKFSYNFGQVKRGREVENEPNSDRRIYLSWVSFALDYSFYF